jgi:hypothetical protein
MYGGKEKCIQRVSAKSDGKNHLQDPGTEGMVILKWTPKKWDGMALTRLL